MRISLLLLIATSASSAQTVPTRGYSAFEGDRKALFDRYARRHHGADSPAAYFNALELSERTTFDAVTHALFRSKLTAEDGRDLGAALTLVTDVERIAGKHGGPRGDQQFRLYARMRPDAVQTLESSREFFRDKDNRLFHAGYPICFRLKGKAPSIQFSLSRDGTKADIDVDYRSSHPPQGLVNGHLRASNSDVRVGRNPRRHTQRWTGLGQWWQSLFKEEKANRQRPPAVQVATPPDRSLDQADDVLAEAVVEFLSDWIVRGQIRAAIEFISKDFNACTNVDEDVEPELRPGDDEFEAILRAALKGLPGRSRLDSAIASIKPWDEAYRQQSHAYDSLFSLSLLTGAQASEYVCRGASGPLEEGEWAVASFALLTESADDNSVLSLLWRKESVGWRLYAYDIEEH